MMLRKSISLLPLLALAACAVGPDYQPPAPPATAGEAFITQGAAVDPSKAPEGDWWRLYNDPVLDGLVRDALAANTDVRQAIARLEKARSLLREAKSDRLPQTGISAGAGYGRATENQVPVGADREDWQINAGFDIGYELDLFGRVKRGVEAARGDAYAAQADVDAVRVMVAAETTRAYADAAAAAERIGVAERIAALLDSSVRLTARRAEAGLTTNLDTARIATLRDQRRAEIPALAAERDAALFRLATLTGRTPAALPPIAADRKTTLRLTQAIPVGDGAQLLARRPDIKAAEQRLAASTARIGIATADLYPRISLGGSVSSSANSISNLFSGGPIGWLLGPLLSWSFPNQEAIRARIEGVEADSKGALAAFDGTVLRALEETETALSRYAHSLERRQSLQSARDQAERAVKIVRAQQREGQVDGLVLLDAERTFAESDAMLALADSQIADAQIDLFRALGGRW